MTVELFYDFWWLMFPIFGMVMAVLGMTPENRAADEVIERARHNLEQR
jgi:hypothetical protein